jgi:hypothetical protein
MRTCNGNYPSQRENRRRFRLPQNILCRTPPPRLSFSLFLHQSEARACVRLGDMMVSINRKQPKQCTDKSNPTSLGARWKNAPRRQFRIHSAATAGSGKWGNQQKWARSRCFAGELMRLLLELVRSDRLKLPNSTKPRTAFAAIRKLSAVHLAPPPSSCSAGGPPPHPPPPRGNPTINNRILVCSDHACSANVCGFIRDLVVIITGQTGKCLIQ